MGDGTTGVALEHRFRPIKKTAAEMRAGGAGTFSATALSLTISPTRASMSEQRMRPLCKSISDIHLPFRQISFRSPRLQSTQNVYGTCANFLRSHRQSIR